MKYLRCLFFAGMLAGAAAALAFLISINNTLPHLALEDGALSLRAEDLSDRLYLLDTQPQTGDGRVQVFAYHLTFDNAQDIALYLTGSEGTALVLNGEVLPVDSDSYMLNLAQFSPGETEFSLSLSYILDGENSYNTPSVSLGLSETVSSIHYYGTYQRIFIIAFSLAILVFCLCLFLSKRSEKYLLWLALMVYSTAGRTALNAFPAWKQIPVLNELLLGTIHWPGLSPAACANIIIVIMDFLLAYIHYRLLKEFIPVTVSGRPYYQFFLPFFAAALLLSGQDSPCYHLLIAAVTVTFLLEAWVIARSFTVHTWHCLIFALAWLLTVASRYFLFGTRLLLIADGLVTIQWRFRGLIETFYAVAFVIVISSKFAHKFSEAEEMAKILGNTNLNLEQQVNQKTEELSGSFHKLEAVQKQKDEFMANIVHSIKTPLFTLGGYADMVSAELETDPQKAREHLAQMNETADYANHLVNNLLLIMRLEDHHIDFHPTEGSLADLFREIQNASSLIAEKRGIRFLCVLPEEPPVISCDFFYIRQALQNMVDNSLAHCGAEDTVRLSARAEEERVRIVIEDSGSGISPEVLPHIFERYYSGSPASPTSKRASSGIGLTISKEIVEQHGGQIFAASEPGRGCTFTVLLPKQFPAKTPAERPD